MRNQDRFPPTYTITFKDEHVKCHSQNTWIYEFEQENEQEHIFIDRSTRDQAKGIYLHRFELEREEANRPRIYNKICKELGRIGVEKIIEPFPSNTDRKVYEKKLAKYGLTASGLAVPAALATQEITPRQEAKIEFLHRLLETDQLNPEEFNGTGELYI